MPLLCWWEQDAWEAFVVLKWALKYCSEPLYWISNALPQRFCHQISYQPTLIYQFMKVFYENLYLKVSCLPLLEDHCFFCVASRSLYSGMNVELHHWEGGGEAAIQLPQDGRMHWSSLPLHSQPHKAAANVLPVFFSFLILNSATNTSQQCCVLIELESSGVLLQLRAAVVQSDVALSSPVAKQSITRSHGGCRGQWGVQSCC